MNHRPLKKLEAARKKKTRKNMVAKKSKPRKARFSDPQTDKGIGYGPNCQTNDMSPHIFDIAKKRFLEALEEDQANRDYINALTLHQHLNRTWRDKRRNLLTSYYFSPIINARNRKSYKTILEKIIYKNEEFSNTAEHRHQKIYEKKALSCFAQLHGAQYIRECGLIIDMDHCFLATSPIRLYGENGIVVIKCPLKAYKKSIQEAIEKKLIPLWKVVSGTETIKKDSGTSIYKGSYTSLRSRSRLLLFGLNQNLDWKKFIETMISGTIR